MRISGWPRKWLSNGVIIDDLVEVSANYGIRGLDIDLTFLIDLPRWREIAAILAERDDIDGARFADALQTAFEIRKHPTLTDATCGMGWPGGIEGPITLEEFNAIVERQERYRHNRPHKARHIKIRREVFQARASMLALQMIDRGDKHQCAHPGCTEADDLTIDHIIPLSRGGSDELSNLQFLCRLHNSSKGAKTPER